MKTTLFFFLVIWGISSTAQESAPLTEAGLSIIQGPSFMSASPGEWKVGDTLTFDFKMKPLPITASAVLRVTQVSAESVTIVEEISYKKIKETIETVLDPASGGIKSLKINGKDQKAPPPSDAKIVVEEPAHLKVKAGEFDTVHFVTEDDDENISETWLDPADVPINGLVKSKSVKGLFTIEMELSSFASGL